MSDGTKASGVNRNYWSATTKSNNTTNAWNVNLSNGNTNNNGKTNGNTVRCVRSEMNTNPALLGIVLSCCCRLPAEGVEFDPFE